MNQVLKQLSISDDARIGTTSSSPFLGSPTFDQIPFHVEVGRRPALGTYVIVVRDGDAIVHYGRIIEGTEDNPRADPLRMQQDRSYQVGKKDPRPSELSPHVTRVMTIDILGEIHLVNNSLEIREPSLLAQTGKGVYELQANLIPWLLNIPNSPDDGLYIGTIESANQSINFMLPMEAVIRHIIVAGKTGAGKSYAVGVLIEELVRHGIPVISFDVLGDVVNAAEDLRGKNYRAGQDFRIPYSVIGLTEFLNFIPNLTHDQSELVALAYDTVFGEALNALNNTGELNVPLSRLITEIETTAGAFGQEAVGSRAARRVKAAVDRNKLLTTATDDWLSQIADNTVSNVFVGHMGQNARNLVVGAASRIIQSLRRSNRIPPIVLVIDEAHMFLPSGHDITPSTYVIRELIRTARHDGIGVVLITQSPSSLDKQILLTCNTRMVFALDPDDLKLISGTMGDVSEEILSRIPKMAKGTSIVSSGMDIMRHPAPIRIRTRETREGAPTPNLAKEVRQWREKKKS